MRFVTKMRFIMGALMLLALGLMVLIALRADDRGCFGRADGDKDQSIVFDCRDG